jgi:hypothetical protein
MKKTHDLFRALLIGTLIFTAIWNSGCTRAPKFIPKPDSQMVAERLVREASGRYKFYVDRIDLNTNQIVQTTEVPEQPYYLLEIPDGRVIFAFTRAPGQFQRKLGEITQASGYKEFMKTAYDSPTPITMYDNHLFILEGLNHSLELGLEIADLKGNRLNYTALSKNAMMSPTNIMTTPRDRTITMFPLVYYKDTSKPDGTKRISEQFILNLSKNEVHKNTTIYSWAESISIERCDTKTVFIAPDVDSRHDQDSPEYVIKRVDKVSYPDMTPIASFPLKDQVHEMAYDPASQKLYARMRDGAGIAVIDSKTNTHLYDLPYAAEAIAYVGKQRLAISIANWKIATNGTPELIEAKLILLDTQTDQIVATFEGNYGHIGRDVGLQGWDTPSQQTTQKGAQQ